MCGIVGIYGNCEKPIRKMLHTIEHRGKDGHSIYEDENIGLGHNRLAIIDLSENGKQPMHNEDKTVWLVVNGEIYNYKDLRSQLISKGHQFYSNSDSEVIIHAYEQWGNKFIHQLSGMFAFALYDKKNNKLMIARDPIGKKPLYYYRDSDNLYFASEIKALLKSGIKAKVNTDMIPTFLMYQYSMGDYTMFEGVRKLKAGHMLIANHNGYHQEQYFSISELILPMEEKDAVQRLRNYFDESVRLRLQADVSIGAFLSGGIDSSAVVALWRKQSMGEIHTFTASFDTFSESEYAKQVSNYLDVEYHEVPINVDNVLRDIEKITWHNDEPLGDAAIINTYYLSQEASKYVKVVLAGEGGDELFGGYQWYKFAKYIKIMNQVPLMFKLIMQLLIGDGNPTSLLERYRRILLFPLQDNLVDMIFYPETSMSTHNVGWITGIDSLYTARSYANILENDFDNYNQMLAFDCLNLLPEKFLMKADKGCMANTIEERLPLLDKDIIQFAFRLPIKFKQDKYILRKTVEDLLPSNIVWRKKQGFGTPVAHWLSNQRFKEYTLDKLKNGVLLKEICNKKSLEAITSHYTKGTYNQQGYAALQFSTIVWNLLTLQIWYDVFTKFTEK